MLRFPLMKCSERRPGGLQLHPDALGHLEGLDKGVPVVVATMTGAMRSVRSLLRFLAGW